VATILVIDDESSIRELLQDALEGKQHSVLVAEDGIEALEKLRANVVDVAIVDLIMPRMHGLELLRRMRDEFAAVKVIVMSAYEDIVDLAQRQKDVVAILRKPFTLAELMDVLQTTLSDT
jgi:CheY-like chemotaxis protein